MWRVYKCSKPAASHHACYRSAPSSGHPEFPSASVLSALCTSTSTVTAKIRFTSLGYFGLVTSAWASQRRQEPACVFFGNLVQWDMQTSKSLDLMQVRDSARSLVHSHLTGTINTILCVCIIPSCVLLLVTCMYLLLDHFIRSIPEWICIHSCMHMQPYPYHCKNS